MDAFSKLFEDEQFYKRVMGEMAKAMYLNYRNPSAEYVELTPSLPQAAEDEKNEGLKK
jgi:hypothetical protein